MMYLLSLIISISVNNDGDLVVVGLDLGLVDIGIRILASVIGFP